MRNPWKLTSFALIALLAAAVGRDAFVTSASADDARPVDAQPKMRAALDHLKAAQTDLEQAAHDKGGHRVKAIALTKQAIDQVQAGIKFDNRH